MNRTIRSRSPSPSRMSSEKIVYEDLSDEEPIFSDERRNSYVKSTSPVKTGPVIIPRSSVSSIGTPLSRQVSNQMPSEPIVTVRTMSERRSMEKPMSTVSMPMSERRSMKRSMSTAPMSERQSIEKPMSTVPMSERRSMEKPMSTVPMSERRSMEKPMSPVPMSERRSMERSMSQDEMERPRSVERIISVKPRSKSPVRTSKNISDNKLTVSVCILSNMSLEEKCNLLEIDLNRGFKGINSHSSLLSAIKQSPDHKILYTLLELSGLDKALEDKTKFYTVFAPNDSAFIKSFSVKSINDAVQQVGMLVKQGKLDVKAILLRHVVQRVFTQKYLKMLDGQKLEALSGDKLSIDVEDGNIYVSDNIKLADKIVTQNGILYPVDKLL